MTLASSASAADTVIAADPAAQGVTALNGTVVWVSGASGAQTLRVTSAAGTGPVPGAPAAGSYRSLDLGLDDDSKLVLTYQRCDTRGSCKLLVDDLGGRRSSLRGLTPKNCSLGPAASLWRSRTAYSLECKDRAKTGLFVKRSDGYVKRIHRPKGIARDASIIAVDLFGTHVAARTSGIAEFAFTQSVAGSGLRSSMAGYSEGDNPVSAYGPLQESSSAISYLTTYAGDSGNTYEARIIRETSGCKQVELMRSAPGVFTYRATGIAVDGGRYVLVVPGTGIVAHDYAPDPTLTSGSDC